MMHSQLRFGTSIHPHLKFAKYKLLENSSL